EGLHTHFEAIPRFHDWRQVRSLEDLTPAIELYHTLTSLGRYEEALGVFKSRLSRATLWRLSANRQRVELLNRLFPDGTDTAPCLSRARDQSFPLNELGLAYLYSGQPGEAVAALGKKVAVDQRENDRPNLAIGLCNLSDARQKCGKLAGAEASARAALLIV